MKIELWIDQGGKDYAEFTKQRWTCDTYKGYYEVKRRRFGPKATTEVKFTVLMIDKSKNQVIYQDIAGNLQALLNRVLAETGDQLKLIGRNNKVVAQGKNLPEEDQNMTLKPNK